jgi:hypothetical protein
MMKQKKRRKSNQPEAAAAVSPDECALYLSPRELAARWKCARSTADRIVSRAGLTKLFLGDGKNGMVRYLKDEVAAYEQSRRT